MNDRTPSQALAVVGNADLIRVLESSLYPGASNESIGLVLSYCQAAGLDPLQKPCHIVPMWDSKASRMRDVVMPGIGLYRTQAARSGQYAGVSEPEFGPDTTQVIGGLEITFPAWCKVTVKRLLSNGQTAEFSATERWTENYAERGGKEKSVAPNKMWARRPYAQLAKCAEAQALRKAFPELGSAPTADEMEGKVIEAEVVSSGNHPTPSAPATLPPYPDDQMARNVAGWRAAIASGKKTPDALIAMISTRYTLSEAQKEAICDLVPADMPEPDFIPAEEVA